MKVFISWSGKRSQAVAKALRNCLETIFDKKVQPWMSEIDLERGDFRRELKQNLTDTHAGVVCVTPENFNPSWMLYEVGFLSRSMEGEFVVPYLLDMETSELKGPLEHLQVRRAERESTRRLMHTINEALGNERFDSGELDGKFNTVWSSLEECIRQLPPPEISIDVKNERGMTLRQAIARVGLMDIENREETPEFELPPEKFYKKATREIVITGVSAYRTFENSMRANLFLDALEKGKKLYIMILHPSAPDVERLSKLVTAKIKHDIDSVIDIFKSRGFYEHRNFQIRFMQTMPPFQGVMIDGDISAEEGSTPEDKDGQIRVQPLAQYSTVHRGVVLQFRKTKPNGGEPAGGFDYFAQDMRKQWRCHGKEYPELFA